jgi:AcrR family transcriptional regulator
MIRAARKLIARQGYTKTTLTQIGRESGYSGGLVTHRFGSKLGLLRTLVGRITGRFYRDQIEPAVGGRAGIDAVCAAAQTYLLELSVREEPMRVLYVLMGEALGPVPEIREVFAELNRGFRTKLAELIGSGIDAGEIRRELDPEAEAALVVGMLRGVAMQWLTDPGCFDLECARRSVCETIEARLRVEEI